MLSGKTGWLPRRARVSHSVLVGLGARHRRAVTAAWVEQTVGVEFGSIAGGPLPLPMPVVADLLAPAVASARAAKAGVWRSRTEHHAAALTVAFKVFELRGALLCLNSLVRGFDCGLGESEKILTTRFPDQEHAVFRELQHHTDSRVPPKGVADPARYTQIELPAGAPTQRADVAGQCSKRPGHFRVIPSRMEDLDSMQIYTIDPALRQSPRRGDRVAHRRGDYHNSVLRPRGGGEGLCPNCARDAQIVAHWRSLAKQASAGLCPFSSKRLAPSDAHSGL